jgi:hypothetical protein
LRACWRLVGIPSAKLLDHPLRAKFERLTRHQERAGWLDETAAIGTREEWAERLRSMGYALRGHRLVRSMSRVCLTGSQVGGATDDGSAQTRMAEPAG